MMRWALSVFVCLLWATDGAWAQTPKVVAEEFRVPHGAGIEIYVRAKRPEGVTQFAPDRIAIMMHGATFPSDPFDLQLGGRSWMDFLAERGFDVYAFDLPGYGRSTRPALMDQPAGDNPPYMRTSDAVKALGSVVDYVSKRRGVERVNLIGWSWGTTITASYAAENAAKVERLVLYAPLWIRTTRSRLHRLTASSGPTASSVAKRPRKAGDGEFLPRKLRNSCRKHRSMRGRTPRSPPIRRARGKRYALPTASCWMRGSIGGPAKPSSTRAKLAAPTLLVVGELDQDCPPYMAQALFPLLVNAKWRRLTLLSDGTHGILLEKHRMLLFRSVQQFLEEAPPTHDAKF